MRTIPAFVSIFGGLVVVWVAWLGRVGRLPRNYLVGIRLPSTMRSDGAWAAAHRVSWIYTAVAGLILSAWGFWVIFDEGAIYVLPEMVLVMLAVLVFGAIRARAAAIAAYSETDGC